MNIYLTISTSKSPVSISPISDKTCIGPTNHHSLLSVDASFKKKNVHNSTITWSQPPSQSPSWCSCPGSCRREQQHVHARPPVGQESPQAHLWKSQSEKMLLTSCSPSMIVFGVFGVGVFTFGIFASFGNDEKYGWSCKWDRYVLIF